VSRRVAITGATGFVGPHLVAALARRGWKIRLLVRRWSPLPSLDGVEADIVLGDLSDEAALKRLVDSVDTIIHAAGLIKARDPADFRTVNRDGTALLSALAPEARFVLLSSLAAREPISRPMPPASARPKRWWPAAPDPGWWFGRRRSTAPAIARRSPISAPLPAAWRPGRVCRRRGYR
jgi:uncharacterized protein YbjT (DUF2867 family)